jgi:hypothetical protein
MASLLAVFLAAVASMVLGFLWFGPLFGKTWMQLMGWKKLSKAQMAAMKKAARKSYAFAFIGALLTAFILGVFSEIVNPVAGAFLIWLGFLVPAMAGMVLWEGKPLKLYLLIVTYHLIALLAMGTVLAYVA